MVRPGERDFLRRRCRALGASHRALTRARNLRADQRRASLISTKATPSSAYLSLRPRQATVGRSVDVSVNDNDDGLRSSVFSAAAAAALVTRARSSGDKRDRFSPFFTANDPLYESERGHDTDKLFPSTARITNEHGAINCLILSFAARAPTWNKRHTTAAEGERERGEDMQTSRPIRRDSDSIEPAAALETERRTSSCPPQSVSHSCAHHFSLRRYLAFLPLPPTPSSSSSLKCLHEKKKMRFGRRSARERAFERAPSIALLTQTLLRSTEDVTGTDGRLTRPSASVFLLIGSSESTAGRPGWRARAYNDVLK